jgi:hypothetical protein
LSSRVFFKHVIMSATSLKYGVYRANLDQSLTIEVHFTLTCDELKNFRGSWPVSDGLDAQGRKIRGIAFPLFKLIKIAAASRPLTRSSPSLSIYSPSLLDF